MAPVTGRRRLALPRPPGAAPLPRAGAAATRGPWFRAHHPANGPWVFASAEAGDPEGGRFDLPEPDGTCYMATTPESAVRERLGIISAGHPLTAAAVAASAVSRMTVTRAQRRNVVDTLDPAASEGITREMSTTTRYGLTRLWAQHWRGVEHRTGVLYEPRFSTGPAAALALFGASGAAVGLGAEDSVAAAELLGLAIPGGVSALSRAAADVEDD